MNENDTFMAIGGRIIGQGQRTGHKIAFHTDVVGVETLVPFASLSSVLRLFFFLFPCGGLSEGTCCSNE